ncbi:lanthionine synthetase LanC family protein [Actinocrispum wychmicini]|uniref:Lanthionine synthetase-like protein n=1 Tax=Actinocrispum wychmicini TaxID=1213861 RepID=A0A4V2S842_9PSEU|nr:lanthionine synthetase LanC family protein [Actinocrispum wychmicini]TCO62190.1 lanthionine synthetase-like protein [Actinocrispum wychmicini]
MVDPDRIAAGVAAMAGQSAFADTVRWRPASLACGDVGAAVLCAAFDAADPHGGWDRTGHRFLTAAIAAVDDPDLPLSLFAGSTGVLAAAALLSRGGTRYPGLRSQLGTAVLLALGRSLHEARGDERDYDVVEGLSGWTAALLLDAAPADVLTALGATLAQLGQDFPEPGMAHGAGGPLAALALLHLHRVPGVRPALRALADRLRTAEVAQVSWCTGALGVARALWLAGRALDDAELRAFATDMALADTDYRTPTLCHGTAGALLVSALFWWDTGDERHRVHADRLCTRLLDAYEPASLFGFRDVESLGALVDNPGVLLGAAGVALVLRAVTASRPPAWARLFLLA